MLTYPALVTNAVRAGTTKTNTNNVCGGEVETLGNGLQLLVAHLLDQLVHVHGGDQLVVANCAAVTHGDDLLVGVNLGDLTLLAKDLLLLGQSVGNGNPDTARAITSREAEGGVGAPTSSGLVEDNVLGDRLDSRSGDTLTEPVGGHLGIQSAHLSPFFFFPSLSTRAATYLCGGNSPDLVVVRAHENVGDVRTHLAHDPLVKVLWLCLGDCGLQGSIDETIHACNLVLLGQHRDVVLERVGDPEALVADVRNTLVVEPVVFLGQSLVETVIKVLVVGEDNVTADIVQLSTLLR